MANLDLIVLQNGRRKRLPSQDQTIDFSSIRLGSSNLPITANADAFNFGSKRLDAIADATTDTAAASWGQIKTYVGQQAISGGVVREQLLTQQQLDDTVGILPGTVMYLSVLPTANDTITITDGTNSETYTFKASETVAFDVAIGVDLPTTMANLAAAITTDSSYWKAFYDADSLDDLYTDGLVGIYSLTTTGFRAYVTQTGGTIAGVIADYSGESQYKTDPSVVGAIPTSDPAANVSGFSKAKASLENGEIHNVLAEDKIYSWDGDYNAGAGQWFILAEGVVPSATSGSGGAIQGKVTADSDLGLSISAGVLSVKVDGTTVGFDGSGQLYIPNDGVDTAQIAASAVGTTELAATSVTAAKLGSDVAGNGLTGGNGSAIAALADSTGGANLATVVNVSSNGLAVKIDSATISENGSNQLYVPNGGIGTDQLAATSVTAAKLGSDVAGNGLTGGNGSALAALADSTTSDANVALVMNVSANGLAVKIDGTTIDENGSNQLYVPNGGIGTDQLAATSVTAAKLGSDVAGTALKGGNGSAIDVDFALTKTNDNAGSVTQGQVVYLKSGGTSVDLAIATFTDLNLYALAIVEDATIASTASGKFIFRRGAIAAGFSGLTPSQPVYVSPDTAGAVTQNLGDFVAGEHVYRIGYAETATTVIYDPEYVIEY